MSDARDLDATSKEVDENMGRLSQTADSLGDSINSLKAEVENLVRAIGEEPIPDPETQAELVENNEEANVNEANAEEEQKEEAVVDEQVNGQGEWRITGGTFATDDEIHENLKDDLQSMSNNVFGEGISGAAEGASLESHTLSKIGHAAEDIHNKLKDVEESLSTKISNIHSLKNVMNTTVGKLIDLIKSTDSTGVSETNAKIIKTVHDKLNEEFDSQIKALQTTLNLKIKPTSADLMDLLKTNGNFFALAQKLGVEYGTEDASDRLAMAYTNMSKLQITAKKVDAALKTLEISLDKYKSLKSLEELKKVLSEVLKKHSTGTATSSLAKVLDAIKTLKGSYSQHGKIIKELKGAMEFHGGDYSTGVGRVRKTNAKSTLKTRVKTYEKTVKELFKNFISQISANFGDIKRSAEALTQKLGNEIVYDDDIRLFISIFESFNSDLNNGKLFYALISLDQTMGGRELKTRFMDNLKNLIESLNVLQKYPYLSDVKTQLELIKENIDTYSDTVLSVRSNEENIKSGKGDFLWSDSLVDPSIPASVSNTIKETITKLKFFGNLAMIKENLNKVSKDYPALQDGYDKLLGKSIGEKLSELQKEYVESVDRLNDKERGRGWLLEEYNKANPANQVPKGLIETIYELQYKAKVGMYKTMEAVDLYLMKFTELVSNDVEALKELDAMLKQTELISAWSDKNSVDNMEELFNQIQPDVAFIMDARTRFNLNIYHNQKVQSYTGGDIIRKVLEASKKSIESVAVLKNIISMFIKIGDKFSNGSLSKENYMSSGTMYNNLVKYIWVSAFTMGYGTGGGNTSSQINSPKKDKNGYDVETGDFNSFFGVKMNIVNRPLDLLGKYEKDLLTKIDAQMAVIKNLENNIGQRVQNAVNAGGINTVIENVNTAFTADTLQNGGTAVPIVDFTSSLNFINAVSTVYDTPDRRLSAYYSLDLIKRNIAGSDIFRTEDTYFVLAMKAITAKILTVVGISNILTQPSKVSSLITNPIRSIMGASESSEVIDGAVELYIRLPLMLEFYKNIFDNGNESYKKNINAGDDSETIAFIPEVGSLWSGLIQCVFDDSKQIANGIYSYENMKRIISEVNKIYKNYSGVEESKLARVVILDLVSEINRRYGILKRKDISEFYQVKKKYSSNMEAIKSNPNDFDILDAAEEFDDMGPSSEFTSSAMPILSDKNKTISNDIELVKNFRDLISKELFSKDLNDVSSKSFSERVKFFKNEIKKAGSQQAKVEIIVKAIDDSSNVNSHNSDVLLVFNELVTYPLANLQKLYRHQVTALIQFLANVYVTLLSSEIEGTPAKANAFLLAKRIDFADTFANNKTPIDTEIKLKKFITQNSTLMAKSVDIGSISPEKFAKATLPQITQPSINDAAALAIYDEIATQAARRDTLIADRVALQAAVDNSRAVYEGRIQAIANANVAATAAAAAAANAAAVGVAPGDPAIAAAAAAVAAAAAAAAAAANITYDDDGAAEAGFHVVANFNRAAGVNRAAAATQAEENAYNAVEALKQNSADIAAAKSAITNEKNKFTVLNGDNDATAKRKRADYSMVMKAIETRKNEANTAYEQANNANPPVQADIDAANDLNEGLLLVLRELNITNFALYDITAAEFDAIFKPDTDNNGFMQTAAAAGRTILNGFKRFGNRVFGEETFTVIEAKIAANPNKNKEENLRALRKFFIDHNTQTTNAMSVFSKVAKVAARFKSYKTPDASVTDIHNLLNRVAAPVDATSKKQQLESKMNLYFALMNYIKQGTTKENDVTVKSIEEFIKRVISSYSDVDTGEDQADPTKEKDLLVNTLVRSLTDRASFLNKEKLLSFFLTNFQSDNVGIKYVASDKFILDYSKLQSSVEKSIEFSKYAISKLRNQINEVSIINNAEKHINNLEENYLLKMIYNQDTADTPIFDVINFENTNTLLSSFIQNSGITFDKNNMYDLLISNGPFEKRPLIRSDLPFSTVYLSTVLKEALKTYITKDRQWKAYSEFSKTECYVFSDIYSRSYQKKTKGSLLLKFNNLIARFLDTFFERSSKKFYLGLISEFSKSQNSCIYAGNGFKDIHTNADVVDEMVFPFDDSVLAESLGFCIKALSTRSANKQLQTKLHAQESIDEVSTNMKEKYKTYLPTFISMFEKIIYQSTMYKKLLELSDSSEINGVVAETVYGSASGTRLFSDEDMEIYQMSGKLLKGDSNAYSHYNNILNNIIEASRALVNDCTTVLNDISNTPVYLQVKDNSIKNFYNNYGKFPILPNSILSADLFNARYLMPDLQSPDNYGKLAYGTNYVLNNKGKINELNSYVWLKDFITSYNNSAPKVNNIELEKLNSYLEGSNSISKTLYEYSFLNQVAVNCMSYPVVVDFDYTKKVKAVDVTGDHMKLNTYFSVPSRRLEDVLSIVENSSTDNNKKIITDFIKQSDKKVFDRVKARLMNIVDMNISPINPHALLREIPLINIYNYAFTFDDIVSKDFKFSQDAMYNADAVVDSRTATAALLLDPYYCVNAPCDTAVPRVPTDPLKDYITTSMTIAQHSLMNPLNPSADSKVAFSYPKYIKDVTALTLPGVNPDNDNTGLRFNSKFTRNMLFLANLHRYILYKIKNEVERVNSKRVNSNHIVNERITSYGDGASNAGNSSNEFDYLMI